jgi:hypothetical protein
MPEGPKEEGRMPGEKERSIERLYWESLVELRRKLARY